MEPLGGVPVRKAALQPVVPRLLLQLSPVLSLPAQREVLVPGDLAQPHPQLAVPPELVDGGQCPEEGLLGHLLRRVGVPAEGQDVAVHVGEIRLYRSPQNPARPLLLSAIGRMDGGFVTKKAPGGPDTFLRLFSAAFLYGKHRSTTAAMHQSHPDSTWMIGSPFPITLRRRKGTRTPLYCLLHRTSPQHHHHCCWSNGSQGPQTGSSRDHPAEQTHTSDSAGRPLLPGDHAPISLFFLRRHYIMETNNLQGGR